MKYSVASLIKILHAADLHIDSPMRGLRRYEGAPVDRLRGATRSAFSALIDLALRERVALVLLAGDLFDGAWKDYNSGLFFSRELLRLRETGAQVVLLRGNHDAQSALVPALSHPGHVTELSSSKAQTKVFDDLGVAVHGRSFWARAVTEDLAASYPVKVPGAFNVGLLHTSADGRPGHEPYAPTTLDVLRSRGYDYWALGHVHTREVLSQDPWVVFPGNLQGRNVRETGPKGATMIVVDQGRVAQVEHVALDQVRWHHAKVSLTEAHVMDDVLAMSARCLDAAMVEAEGRLCAVRLTLVAGASSAALVQRDGARLEAELRRLAQDRGGDDLFLEKVVLDHDDTERPKLAGASAWLPASLYEPDDVAALGAELGELLRKLPQEVTEGPDGFDPSSSETLTRLLRDAEALARARLSRDGGT